MRLARASLADKIPAACCKGYFLTAPNSVHVEHPRAKKNQDSQYSQWSICPPAPDYAKTLAYECDTIRRIQNATADVLKCAGAGVERSVWSEQDPPHPTLDTRPSRVRLLTDPSPNPPLTALSNFDQL
jgi:hypothetical protein